MPVLKVLTCPSNHYKFLYLHVCIQHILINLGCSDYKSSKSAHRIFRIIKYCRSKLNFPTQIRKMQTLLQYIAGTTLLLLSITASQTSTSPILGVRSASTPSPSPCPLAAMDSRGGVDIATVGLCMCEMHSVPVL